MAGRLDGKIAFQTFRKSQKALNLRRDPRISVMLESGTRYDELKGLVIEGHAEHVGVTLGVTQRAGQGVRHGRVMRAAGERHGRAWAGRV